MNAAGNVGIIDYGVATKISKPIIEINVGTGVLSSFLNHGLPKLRKSSKDLFSMLSSGEPRRRAGVYLGGS
jgi:hypothetical protein